MKTLRSSNGGYTLLEAIIVVSIGVAVIAWVLPSIRSSQVLRGISSMETLQSEQYQKLNPVIEDIREANNNSMLWDRLDPTNALLYNPKKFPWFFKEDPAVAGSRTYICFYFDDARKALVRVQTAVKPDDMETDPCELNPDRSEKLLASGLLTPTAAYPMFRGDPDRLAVFFTLRLPLSTSGKLAAGMPKSVLEVVRMGSVRS